MQQNAYFVAKIGADTAENEQHSAEILPIGRPACTSAGGPRGRSGPWAAAPAQAVVAEVRAAHLQGSFSAVSKPNFASKYSLESSRRNLHNALLCTALKSHVFLKSC